MHSQSHIFFCQLSFLRLAAVTVLLLGRIMCSYLSTILKWYLFIKYAALQFAIYYMLHI